MKKKNIIILIVFVVLIIGLAGAYYGLQVYNNNVEEAEEEAAEGETVLDMDSADVTAISFIMDGGQVSFTKQDDETWVKDDDDTFPVDASALLAPLDNLAPLKSLRTLSDTEDVSEYGFDEPQNVIILTDLAGNETTLTIGDKNQNTGNDYLMIDEDTSNIYTISTALRTSFSDNLYDYAKSEDLPSLQASDIVGISAQRSDGSWYSLYLDDAVWMVSGEEEKADNNADVTAEELLEGVEADADLANDIADSLAGISYKDFLDHNCTDFSPYGLDDPLMKLTITYEEVMEIEEEAEPESEDTAEDVTDKDDDDTESLTGDEAETETETETGKTVVTVDRFVVFYIGDQDDSGNYYVKKEDSSEVHTFSEDLVASVFDYSGYDLVAPEEEETETEETETETRMEETGTEAETE